MKRSKLVEDILAEADRVEELDATESDAAIYVRPRAPRDPSQVYSVRIPVSAIDDLREMAEGAHLPVTTFMRHVVADQVDHFRRSTEDEPQMIAELVDQLERSLEVLRARLTTLDKTAR
jgi:hypothetical protein